MIINNIVQPPKSTFLSCEKDAQEIIEKLFVKSRPYDEELKRLLIINAKDCLDNKTSEIYKQQVEQASVKNLMDAGYIKFAPILKFEEHEEIKSYLMLSFDNFTPNATNPEFRDCTVHFDIICHTDYWDIGNFRLRPLKIAGYIDGILNESKLSGIGTLHFAGASELILNPYLSGYSLMYSAVHGSDDWIPGK